MDEQPWTKWSIHALSILSMAARPYRPFLLLPILVECVRDGNSACGGGGCDGGAEAVGDSQIIRGGISRNTGDQGRCRC